MFGGHYEKLRTLYHFCSWEMEIVKNEDAKRATLLDFSYERRDTLYRWVNESLLANVPIDYIEFGVYQGESLRKWRSINRRPESRFWGFDSFEGLPEDWGAHASEGTFDVNGIVPRIEDSRVNLVKGLFQETLPDFLCSFKRNNRMVIHLDADLYSSTLYVLIHMDRAIVPGSILIFDEFGAIDHEFAALREFARVCNRKWKLLGGRKGFDKAVVEIL
ncbi:MAG: macrocin O-methyltransferase [Nitrospinae bacterium]|nr:macrocin O-methyltransferase [Nitrospinota bacterium]